MLPGGGLGPDLADTPLRPEGGGLLDGGFGENSVSLLGPCFGAGPAPSFIVRRASRLRGGSTGTVRWLAGIAARPVDLGCAHARAT